MGTQLIAPLEHELTGLNILTVMSGKKFFFNFFTESDSKFKHKGYTVHRYNVRMVVSRLMWHNSRMAWQDVVCLEEKYLADTMFIRLLNTGNIC
jgi:hypothetical protein